MSNPPPTSPPTPAPATATASAAAAVEFDFASRSDRAIAPGEAPAAVRRGMFCWIDADAGADPAGAARLLGELGADVHAVREALGPDVDGRYDAYDTGLHVGVTAAAYLDGRLVPSPVDFLIGQQYLVTLRRGPVEFVEQVRRVYRRDFVTFARTPSFLLYECWDQLIEGYKRTFRRLEEAVDHVQGRIFGRADDGIFNAVAGLTRDLLQFRKIVLAAREVLHELSTRRSSFVAESAQPFLEKMGAALERLGADLAVEREVLAEAVNLYMGVVSHRTNKVVNRLTVVSMVFLPLTFLCGVYGMNFAVEDEATHKNLLMPELTWRYGYVTFWAIAVTLTTGLLVFMKRRKWW